MSGGLISGSVIRRFAENTPCSVCLAGGANALRLLRLRVTGSLPLTMRLSGLPNRTGPARRRHDVAAHELADLRLHGRYLYPP